MPPYAELNLGSHVGDDPRTVRDNRTRLAAAVGLPPGRLVFMEQVHGAQVALVDGPLQTPPVADALVTRSTGLALAVLVADCVPLLLADAEAGVVAAVHAGRRGVELGVAPAALRAMQDCGARPERVHAWMGPAVGGCCYEVPEEMRDAVAAVAPGVVEPDALYPGGRTVGWGPGYSRAGRPALDLRSGLARQLSDVGVAHVGLTGGCTAEDRDQFSYRRDGVTGRSAGLVWLTSER